MGCGKSEVARSLASRLKLGVIDLDEAITQRVKRSPAQLINEEGEVEFRLIETGTLAQVLEQQNAVVISLGGGAWIEQPNRDLLERNNVISIWLNTPFEICWSRIESDSKDRPLGRTKEQAMSLFQRRQPIYELALIHIPTDAIETAEATAARIEAQLTRFEI